MRDSGWDRQVKNKGKGLTGQALKEFRHSVSILKAKGLVRKSTDARSQKATNYMKSKVKKLSDVIEGKQTALKVSKDVLKRARAEHQRVINGRVLAPAGQPKMHAEIRRGNFIERVTDTGRGLRQREIDLTRFFSMRQFLDIYDDHPHDLDRLKPKEFAFAFTYFGNRTRMSFPNAEEMLGVLRYYISASGAGEDGDLEGLWDGFSLYSVEATGRWERETSQIQKERRQRHYQKRMRRMKKRNEQAYENYLNYQAEKQARHRARLTPEKKELYQEKARERAQKSRDKKKMENADRKSNG